jgi:hypothetical protein
MNRFTSSSKFLAVAVGAILMLGVGSARGQDTNFSGNVTVSSNLTVDGSVSATNIVPSQASASIAIAGAISSGSAAGGSVLISGGHAGYDLAAGNVVVQGGTGTYGGAGGNVLLLGGVGSAFTTGGNVILQGGTNAPGYTVGSVILQNQGSGGYVELQTSDGTTRFWLQSDGTFNASGNYINDAKITPQGDLTMGSFTNYP